MQDKDVFLLEDIIEHCEKVEQIARLCNNNFATFSSEDVYESSCAFHVMQIGELSNALSDNFKNNHPEVEWFKIVGLRNRIAHEYGDIDVASLWKTVEESIPELCRFCRKQIS